MVCELFKGYSLPNVDNPDLIVGSFNGNRDGMAMIVTNEASSQDSKHRKIDMDSWKSPITESTFMMRELYMPARKCENINNFIFTTNHEDSLRLTADDRRYQVINVSDKYINDLDIMEPFFADNYSDELMNALYTFYMNLEMGGHKRNEIIKTQAKLDLIEASKSSYEQFVEEYADWLNEKDRTCSEVYESYVNFCCKFGFKDCSINTFGLHINDFLERYRGGGGCRPWLYRIKPLYKLKLADDGYLSRH